MRLFVWFAALLTLTGCGGKKPDAAQEVRVFLADWERAVDSQNAAALDSLIGRAENAAPIKSRKMLDELFSAPEVRSINLRGRQFGIGEKQATVSGLLIRSGVPDSISRLLLILLKTSKGWKLVDYKWEPLQTEQDSASPSA